jgi:hypothetical protein
MWVLSVETVSALDGTDPAGTEPAASRNLREAREQAAREVTAILEELNA